MTREEIERMPAGREMDVAVGHMLGVKPPVRWLVVDKVDGGSFIGFDYQREATDYLAEAMRERPNGIMAQRGKVQPWEMWARYSVDIAAAWQVFEWLKARRAEQGGGIVFGWTSAGHVIATGFACDDVVEPTAPLVICRAALLNAGEAAPVPAAAPVAGAGGEGGRRDG